MAHAARTAAIGLKAHSGWAALVAVATRDAPAVIDRVRITTADPDDPAARFPYHAAEKLGPEAAERLVAGYVADARARARRVLGGAIARLAAAGYAVVGCALLVGGGGRALPALPAILASHAMIHTAEGLLFRDVLRAAAEHHAVKMHMVVERGLLERAAPALAMKPAALAAWAAGGRALGPPWGADQKLAAVAARLVLAGAGLTSRA